MLITDAVGLPGTSCTAPGVSFPAAIFLFPTSDFAFAEGSVSKDSTSQWKMWEGEEPKRMQYGFKLMNVDGEGLPHAMFIDAAKLHEFEM